jgi:hypothetical protein
LCLIEEAPWAASSPSPPVSLKGCNQVVLTVEARPEKAKELVDSGLSQRQAAKALGVSHTTVQQDLAEGSTGFGRNEVRR